MPADTATLIPPTVAEVVQRLEPKDDYLIVKPYRLRDPLGIELPEGTIETPEFAAFPRQVAPDKAVMDCPVIAVVVWAGPGQVNREATTAVLTEAMKRRFANGGILEEGVSLVKTLMADPVRWPMPHKPGDVVMLSKPGAFVPTGLPRYRTAAEYEQSLWATAEPFVMTTALELTPPQSTTRARILLPNGDGVAGRIAAAAGR